MLAREREEFSEGRRPRFQGKRGFKGLMFRGFSCEQCVVLELLRVDRDGYERRGGGTGDHPASMASMASTVHTIRHVAWKGTEVLGCEDTRRGTGVGRRGETRTQTEAWLGSAGT